MLKGIDVSEHNEKIDFAKVKQDGINFVIIRIGWIGNKENHTIDTYFEENYKNAKANGLKVGFYVYSYVENETAMISAIKWVKKQISNKSYEYPIFLDIEDKQIANLSKEMQTKLCKHFCDNFSNSGVYANLEWFNNKLNVNELLNYKIWLAQWTNVNTHSADFKVDLWQYADNGNVNGINGRVDMNYCLNCNNSNSEEITGENGSDEEVRVYQNGSTVENVYSDTNLTNKIGSLNKYEACDCFGIFNNRAMVRYKVNGSNNYKIGFCKWLGGVK